MNLPLSDTLRHEALSGAYMSQRQLDFFQNLLREERDALLKSAYDTTEHMHDTGAISDVSDRATQEEEDSRELRIHDRDRRQLDSINDALARIGDGRYGWCDDTGEAIGIPRLLALPTTHYSLEAQTRHERQQRMIGG